MLTQYTYFVTRPHAPEIGLLVSPALAIWILLAVVGSLIWLRHPTTQAWPYLGSCLVLSIAVILGIIITPRWFPLQSPRFLATLVFLLAVPVGFALAEAFRRIATLLGEISQRNPTITLKRVPYTSAVAGLVLLILVLTMPALSWAYAFYPKGEKRQIDDVLEFARQHRDGRYLVEVINPKIGPAWTEASFDARAINSYLGSQGNETISGVFHEASPNALFTLPVVNAFSNYPDSFGVSSVLADDLDFKDQPLVEQIKRVQFLGVKYLFIRTPAMKERVEKELSSAVKHELGWWTVFELPGRPVPKVQALAYKPALVVSDFTVKARRRNELSFIRFVEEQFADNWFDVLLVRPARLKIDKLADLDKFGALVIEKYDYDDEDAAFDRLVRFAADRSVICLSSNNSLFRRLEAARVNFPYLEIVGRQLEKSGEMVEALEPTYRYNASSIRQQWKTIRGILERNKVPTDGSPSEVAAEISHNSIKLNYSAEHRGDPVPVLISTTFHPNWRRNDSAPVYAATPFYMLTFVDKPTIINYGRQGYERLGLWTSGTTLVLLFFMTGFSVLRSLVGRHRKSSVPNS